MKRRRQEHHDSENDDPKQKRNQPFTPGRIRASQKLNNSIEPDDRDRPYGTQKRSKKYSSIRDSNEINKGQIPAIQGRHQNGSNLDVNPSVSIFENQRKSQDPDNQHYQTAQFKKMPAVKDSVDWDLDGRKRTQKIFVKNNKISNKRLPKIHRDHQNSVLTTQTEQPSVLESHQPIPNDRSFKEMPQKQIRRTSSDESLTYEEYLAKQQKKFKKLYGKKLIVEDDYLNEDMFKARQEKREKSRGSIKGSAEPQKRHSISGNSIGQARASQDHAANTLFTLGNNSRSRKFIDIGRMSSYTHSIEQKSSEPVNGQTSIHEEKYKKEPSLTNKTQQEARSKDKNSQHTGYPTHQTQQDARSKADAQSHLCVLSNQTRQDARSKDNTLSKAGILTKQTQGTRQNNTQSQQEGRSLYTNQDGKSQEKAQSHAAYPTRKLDDKIISKDNNQQHTGVLSQISNQINHQSRYSRMTVPQAVQSQTHSSNVQKAKQISRAAPSNHQSSQKNKSSRNQTQHVSNQINAQQDQNFEVDDNSISRYDPSKKSKEKVSSKRSAEEFKLSQSRVKTSTSQPPYKCISNNGIESNRSYNQGMGSHRSLKSVKVMSVDNKQHNGSRNTLKEQIMSKESRNQTCLLQSQIMTEDIHAQPHLETDDFTVNRTNPNTNRTHLKAQEVSLGGQSINMIMQDSNARIQDIRMMTGFQTVFSQPTETQMAIMSGHQPKSTGKRNNLDQITTSNPPEANLDIQHENEIIDNVTTSQVRFQTNMISERKQLHNDPTPRTNMALNRNFKINSHTAFEIKQSQGAHERQINAKIDITSSNSAGVRMASQSPSDTQGFRNLNKMKLGKTFQNMNYIQSDTVMIQNSIQKRYSTSQPGARSFLQNRGQKISINKAISSNSIGKYSKGKNARVRNIEQKSDEKNMFGHRNSHPQQKESVSKSRSASKRGSQNYISRSPQRFNEKAKLMEDLTGGKVQVNEQSKLLINGSEILSQAGISGKINQVGVGFGTGRHTQSRKSTVARKELVMQSQKSQMIAKQAQTMFMLPGIFPPDVVSIGCEAFRGAQKSELLSARNPDVGNFGHSPRTQTIKSLKSVGLSAKQSTVKSRRDQMDQVSVDRFNPLTNEEPTQTSYLLLQEYIKRPQNNQETCTEPVKILDEEVFRTSIMIQTLPIIEERDLNEPQPLIVPDEPLYRGCGQDDAFQTNRSLTSQLSTPLDEKPCEEFEEQLPPPQDPDEQITDDWAKSGLFIVVQQQKYDCLLRKGMIETEQVPRSEHAMDNKLASLEDQLIQNLNPDGRTILSLIDCDYGQALLRKKRHTQDFEKIAELYSAAKTTIEKLTENMIKPDISLHIFFKYYQDVNRKNVIKLLLRCKRLYDARNQMVHILVHVMQIEEVLVPKNILWRILQDNTPVKRKNHISLVRRTLRFLSSALTKISTFQQEHRLFAGEFKFNRDDYIEFIVQIGQIIGGFMIRKKEANPALQLNGLLLEDHDEEDIQKMAYKEWVTRSEREFGRMDLPTEEQTERWLPEETISKDFNDSRVAKALKAMTSLDQAHLQRAEKMQAQALEHPEYQPLESEKMVEAGKTLISEQAIDRAQWSVQKRKIIEQLNLNKQPSEEIDYEREEEKLKLIKMPGLHLLKQKLKYDDDLDGETVNNQKSDLISKEQPSIELRMGMQAYPSQSEITYVQHDKSIMQSEDINIRSQEDFALESPKIKLQLGDNLAREVGTANFNDGKSETNMHRGHPPSLFKRENSDYGQDLTKELITLPVNVDKQQKIKVIPPKFKQPQGEILKKSLVRHQDMVSENTSFQPINKKYNPIQTKDVDVISEASEFTYQQVASQRILLETNHFKEDETEQEEREQSQANYINVMSETEDSQVHQDFLRDSSMQHTSIISKGKAMVNQSIQMENTKIKLKKTTIAGQSSGNKAVTRK